MSRDVRGRPGRIVLNGQPRLKLADVLRRRRSTLQALAGELGLTTYAALAIWCDRMGIVAPTEAEFNGAVPHASQVHSPQEGVIVLPEPPLVEESIGQPVDAVLGPPEPPRKKDRVQKGSSPTRG